MATGADASGEARAYHRNPGLHATPSATGTNRNPYSEAQGLRQGEDYYRNYRKLPAPGYGMALTP